MGSAGRQFLYGIVQGGVYEDLRKIACEETCSGNYHGLAIGGSLGGTKEQMHDIFSFCWNAFNSSGCFFAIISSNTNVVTLRNRLDHFKR